MKLSKIYLIFSSIFLLPSSLFSLTLSPQIGKIDKQLDGANGKTIYLIQEAHADYEGQKSLMRIIEAAAVQEGTKLILVEGGWGDVSLTDLQQFGTAEERAKIAEQYMKEGKLSAEEYLDLEGFYALDLWGVEDPKLYEENMEAFLHYQPMQSVALEALEKARQGTRGIKSESVRKWLDLRRQKTKDQLPIFKYVTAVLHLAESENPDLKSKTLLKSYPLLSQIMEMTSDQGPFDLEKVEAEKSKLINVFSRRLSKNKFQKVQSLLLSEGKHDERELIDALLGLHEAYPKISKKLSVKHLLIYRDALEKLSQTDSGQLFSELSSLDTELLDLIPKTPEEKAEMEMHFLFDDLQQLFSLQLGPEDWARLKAKLVDHRNPSLDILHDYIPAAAAFYEKAIQREDAMIKNSIEKIQTYNGSSAALITGGFHRAYIMRKLHDAGFTVVSVTPSFAPSESGDTQEKYFRALKEKWEKRKS